MKAKKLIPQAITDLFIILIFGYFAYIINPNFVRTDLKLLFLKTILKNQNEKFIDSEAKSFARERLENFSNKKILKTILKYNKEGALLIIASGSLDVYVKYFAKLLKMNEVPMVLRYDLKKGASKMSIFKTIFQTLFLLFRRKFFK